MITLTKVSEKLQKDYACWDINSDRAIKIEAGTQFDHVYTVTSNKNGIVLVDVVYKCDEKIPFKTNVVSIMCATLDTVVIAIQDYICRHEDEYNWDRTGIWATKPVMKDHIMYFVLK